MSPGPSVKYYEVLLNIVDKINRGEYPRNSLLPSEPQLAQIYKVSRGTIRQALDSLERQGMIARISGKGTLIVGSTTKEPTILSFTEQVRRKGKIPSTQVLATAIISAADAGGRVQEAFLLDEQKASSTSIYFIDRLRCADNLPVAHQKIYLLASDFSPGLLNEFDFSGSIFNLYNRFYRHAAWADEFIQARQANPDEVELFQMVDLPIAQRLVYERDRITYDDHNLALEVLKSIERSDFFVSYRYHILTRQ